MAIGQDNFVPIPKIPQTDVTPWMYGVLTALQENVEVFMGVRAEGVRAVTSDRITVPPQTLQFLKHITANGLGYTADGAGALPANVSVASLADHVRLAQDVQSVINDVARIESALNTLLGQLRS